jgi:hypothetical protein
MTTCQVPIPEPFECAAADRHAYTATPKCDIRISANEGEQIHTSTASVKARGGPNIRENSGRRGDGEMGG